MCWFISKIISTFCHNLTLNLTYQFTPKNFRSIALEFIIFLKRKKASSNESETVISWVRWNSREIAFFSFLFPRRGSRPRTATANEPALDVKVRYSTAQYRLAAVAAAGSLPRSRYVRSIDTRFWRLDESKLNPMGYCVTPLPLFKNHSAYRLSWTPAKRARRLPRDSKRSRRYVLCSVVPELFAATRRLVTATKTIITITWKTSNTKNYSVIYSCAEASPLYKNTEKRIQIIENQLV